MALKVVLHISEISDSKREKSVMKRKYLFVVFAAVLGLGMLVPEVATAQYGYGYGAPRRPRWGFRHRRHFYLGGQLMGMAMLHQGLTGIGQIGAGGGVGLTAGFRIHPMIGLEANWTWTAHDETWEDEHGNVWVDQEFLQIQTLTADVKIHIPTRGRIEPFVQGGVGFAFIGVTGDWATDGYIFNSGPTFNLGGGLDLWLGPWFSIGGRILYRGMYFGDNEYEGQWVDCPAGSCKKHVDKNYLSGLSVDFFATIHF